MRFRPRGRAQPVRATCSLGRVAFGRARGRGEFERVAAAHEDLSVCVPMCSRLPPGELAWGRAPGETRGRGNAMPLPWKLRLHHRFSKICSGSRSQRRRPAALGVGSKRCRRASPRDHGRQTSQTGDAVVEPAPRGGNDAWPFAPRRRAPVTIRAMSRGTPGLTWGPRATDGAPTGSLRPRRRPRLCPRSTHRNPGSKSTRSPRRRAGQRWQPRASSPR